MLIIQNVRQRGVHIMRVLTAAVITFAMAAAGLTGLLASASPAGAANPSAPVINTGGYAGYDLTTSQPNEGTTTSSAIATPSSATSLPVAATYGTTTPTWNGISQEVEWQFAPIGDLNVTSTCGTDVFQYSTITLGTGAETIAGSFVSGNLSCSISSGSSVTQATTPSQFNVLTLVQGGASAVNTSSLTILQQPPTSDGFAQVTTSASTGIITMTPQPTATGTFSVQFAYCNPGVTYSLANLHAAQCSTGTLTYTPSSAELVGWEGTVIIVATTEYLGVASSIVAPSHVTQGQTFTMDMSPDTQLVPEESTTGITVHYETGLSFFAPVPAGLTYVPGSAHLIGGDASTLANTSVAYCTAANQGTAPCSATEPASGNYNTPYPYIAEALSSSDQVAAGNMATLPEMQAQFTATGAPGTTPSFYSSQINASLNVTDVFTTTVNATLWPTTCPSFTQYGTTYGCPTSGTPAYALPAGVPITTIVGPSVTGVSTPNGGATGPSSGGSTVTISGQGFTGASAVDFGGTPATSYTVNNDGQITAVSPAGSDGTVDITVTNDGNTSTASSADQFTYTDATAPDAPTNVAASPDNGQAEVSYTPGFNEGSSVTGYTVTATDQSNGSDPSNGATCAGTDATGCTVTGLTNGDSYTFTATATNGIGTSGSSAPSAAITSGSPSAPLGVVATAGQNGQSTVSWSPPASAGGLPGAAPQAADTVQSYTVTATDTTNASDNGNGNTCTSTDPTDSCTISGLVNGDSYTFGVTATNSNYTGPAGTSAAIVPSAPPSAPTGVTAAFGTTAGVGSATVSWTRGAANGATPSYTATATDTTNSGDAGNGNTCTTSGASCSITGLTLGDQFTFNVTATNVSGSATSSSTTAATDQTVPTAPQTVTAVAGNGQAVVSWSAPASNGGNTITKYTATSSTGSKTCTSTTGSPITPSCTVTGLTNGTAYTFTVTATNGVGTSAASAASNSVTPSTVPSAPTGVTATSGVGQATVSWTAGSNGGSGITSYTATSSPGGFTCTSNSPSPPTTNCVVTGLTNGTSYTFTVNATNINGTSANSSASAAVVIGIPGVPTAVTAVPGNASATVSWTAPANTGAGPITSYTAKSNSGTTCTSNTGSPVTTSCTITGLTNGTSYTFTVDATNAYGSSAFSSASSSIKVGVPTPPLSVTAVAGNTSAVVSWHAPASQGSGTITGYTATSSTGSKTCTTTGALTCTVSGLTNGTAYTFTVTATNATGTSAASVASNSITPATAPGAPTAVSATPGNGQATVNWTAPASNGGATILSYRATSSPGGFTCTSSSPSPPTTSCVVTGLTNGTAYTFTVTATNDATTSAASTASAAVTPSTTPDAPTNVTAAAGDQSASVSWVPGFNEGSTTTSYTVTASDSTNASNGGEHCTYTVSTPETDTCTVTGLTNGDSYSFTVAGTNGDGAGATSVASNSVTPSGVPSAPTGATATAGSLSASVSWTPGYDNGAAITSYTVTASDSSNPGGQGDGNTCTGYDPADSCTVTGLSNDDTYTFTVTETNANGTSSASSPSNGVEPTTVPDAPTNVQASAGDTEASVSWVPGADNGLAITSYTVTASGVGGQQCTYTVSSPETDTCTVTGLSDGTAYTFTVTATNANGTGPASAPSTSVTPSTVPDAPTGVSAQAGDQSATVSWTPGFDEGSTITSYTVTASDTSNPGGTGDGNTCTGYDPSDTCTVTGLANNDSYTFTVTATNGDGTGAASAASNSVTPSSAPDAPTNVEATAGDQQASVSWVPGFDEGSAITSYTVSASGVGGQQCTYIVSSPETDTCTVTGLSNGTAYTFTVTASNGNGSGAASDPSSAVTPTGTPDAPTGVTATAGNGSAIVSWTPGFDEGLAISSFTATASPGGASCTTSTTSCTLNGLTNGTTYTVTVTATNGNGAGQASNPPVSVTPSSSAPLFAATTTFARKAGTATSVTVSATGMPLPTVSESTPLPSWLTFTPAAGRGTFSGTPPTGSGGSYTFSLAAHNSHGEALETITIDIIEITSANTTTFTTGQYSSFPVTSSLPDATISTASVLPSGVTLTPSGPGTAVLSGTPAANTGKAYKVILKATEGTAVYSQTFNLVVDQAPQVVALAEHLTRPGKAVKYVVSATGYPVPTLTAGSDLPSWLTYTPSVSTTTGLPIPNHGVISGTVPTNFSGSVTFTLNADSSSGHGSEEVTIDVLAITTANTATFTVGQSGSFDVDASLPGATFSSTTLPSGLAVSPDGTLSGTPAAGTAGVHHVTLKATVGTVTYGQAFTLVIDSAPAFTSASSFSIGHGRTFSFTVKASGYPLPTLSPGTDLPSWVTFTPSATGGSATLTGTAPAAQTVSFRVHATNSTDEVTETITINVT